MRLSTIVLLVSLITGLPAAQTRGAWYHQFGRSAGMGWSDGYHSRTGCPPKGCGPDASSAASAGCPTCHPTVSPLPSPAPSIQPFPIPDQRATWRIPTPSR